MAGQESGNENGKEPDANADQSRVNGQQPSWLERRTRQIKDYAHRRHAKNANENPQDRNSRRVMIFTGILAIAAVLSLLLGYGQYRVYRGQQRLAKRQVSISQAQNAISERQLRLTEVDERPWLILGPLQIIPPLVYEGGGDRRAGTIAISYQIKNIGKSPAVDYSLDVMPMVVEPFNPNPEWHDRQKERCAGQKAKVSSSSYKGQELALLPGQQSPALPYVFRKNEIDNYFIKVGIIKSYTVFFYGWHNV